MNREGQVFYRESWHLVLVVVRSYQSEDSVDWCHDLIALSDFEEMIGPDITGNLYTWPESTAAHTDPRSPWSRL